MLHDPHDARPGSGDAPRVDPPDVSPDNLRDSPRDSPPDLPAELQHFLAAGSPPVVITPGSANVHADRLFSLALAAIRRLGRRAVCLTPHRAQVPAELPPEVLWLPYVPLGALLPHAALLLHHGGVGTLAQALAAGVPQLVVPHGWDQYDNAVRLRRLGVARSRPIQRLVARPLRRDLDALLNDPQVRSACAVAARRLAGAPAPADLGDLCRRIEAQATGHPDGDTEKFKLKTTQLQM